MSLKSLVLPGESKAISCLKRGGLLIMSSLKFKAISSLILSLLIVGGIVGIIFVTNMLVNAWGLWGYIPTAILILFAFFFFMAVEFGD